MSKHVENPKSPACAEASAGRQIQNPKGKSPGCAETSPGRQIPNPPPKAPACHPSGRDPAAWRGKSPARLASESVAGRQISRENPLAPRDAVVKKKVVETGDTVSLALAVADGERYSFLAGQFNMLGLPGFGEAPISFSSLIADGGEFVHTIRVVGNVTREICSRRVGDLVQLRGPFGNGWPVEKAHGRNLIIVAGGIGMAPLRPVIQHVVRDRKKFGRVFLLYGARTADDILYGKELKKWGSEHGVAVGLSVDIAPPKAQAGLRVGVVTTLFDLIDAPLQDSVAFTCGPEIMMRFVARQLLLKGQKPCDIYVSLERRMKCGIGHCGHCQIGAKYVCKDGPVFSYDDIKRFVDTLL